MTELSITDSETIWNEEFIVLKSIITIPMINETFINANNAPSSLSSHPSITNLMLALITLPRSRSNHVQDLLGNLEIRLEHGADKLRELECCPGTGNDGHQCDDLLRETPDQTFDQGGGETDNQYDIQCVHTYYIIYFFFLIKNSYLCRLQNYIKNYDIQRIQGLESGNCRQ